MTKHMQDCTGTGWFFGDESLLCENADGPSRGGSIRAIEWRNGYRVVDGPFKREKRFSVLRKIVVVDWNYAFKSIGFGLHFPVRTNRFEAVSTTKHMQRRVAGQPGHQGDVFDYSSIGSTGKGEVK